MVGGFSPNHHNSLLLFITVLCLPLHLAKWSIFDVSLLMALSLTDATSVLSCNFRPGNRQGATRISHEPPTHISGTPAFHLL